VGVAAVLTAAVVALSLRYMDPFPPRRIVLTTGQVGGTYDAVGREYQRRLARAGLRVDLVASAGSVENLRRLLDGKADVAFVQGGTYPLVSDPEGRLRGMGAPGSGTEAVARALLGELGLPASGDNRLGLPSAEARRRLEEGTIDAAFFVSSYQDVHVAALLRRPDVRLLGFTRDVAFARNFRYLSPVRLTEGLLDLKDDLPREETTVMAPAALLVCRATLHPRVVEQLLSVARDVHGGGSLIDAPLRFPTREGVDVPLHEAADSFLQRGESLMSRVLPYWALRWVVQLRLVLLPLLAVWVPLFKILPWVIRWRGNRILERHYAVLRDLEGAIAGAAGPEALRGGIARLEALRGQIETLARRLPLQHQRDVYHCRVHVSLVLAEARDRLRRLERAAAV
jgi:hypothetical protein